MEIRLDELVALLGGELLTGDPATVLMGVASLDEANSGEASFLGNEKYAADFQATKAGVVIVPPMVEAGPKGVALVRCENPSLAFSTVVALFAAELEIFEPGVHPAAIVAEGVEFDPEKVSIGPGAIVEGGVLIGAGTRIGAGTVVGRDVVLGEDCTLYPNVTVRERCRLGNRVIVQPGAVIGSDGYGFELVEGRHVKIPQVGIVVVEDDVEIGANTTIDRARFGRTVIGEGTKIDNQVQVAHNARIGKHCLLVAQAGVAGSSTLGDYVVMAAKSGLSGHVSLGDQVVLAGMAGAAKDISKAGVYLGLPARPIREELKARAALGRLPDLLKQMREMRQEIEELKKQR
ncbi:MAG: UDP-3-O-(3-hydroxymyristoyl)glucosamine N-acyltransferase [Verrucomicrobia bacterium]|nr:UDP-3-O-(3-hydroxymyristoyl)glucosamine N-acyltransferase [Verrucomicrobiota bacterium]